MLDVVGSVKLLVIMWRLLYTIALDLKIVKVLHLYSASSEMYHL